jgi:hypothetical protein
MTFSIDCYVTGMYYTLCTLHFDTSYTPAPTTDDRYAAGRGHILSPGVLREELSLVKTAQITYIVVQYAGIGRYELIRSTIAR